MCRSRSGLEYALRLDVSDALGVSLSDVLVDSLRATEDGQTQVSLTFPHSDQRPLPPNAQCA